MRLAWGAAFAVAVGCGQKFTQDDASAGAAGTTSAGGSAAGGGKPSTGPVQGGNAGRGGTVPSLGGDQPIISGTGPFAAAGGEGGDSSVPVDMPPPIPVDGLELWFDASRGVAQVNGSVSGWADQSGHHRDALQTAGNLRPKLVDGALAGKPAVVFDGSPTEGDYLKLPTLDASFAQGVSMFVAGQEASETDAQPCEGFFEASNGPEVDDIHIGTWQKSLIFEVYQLYINDTSFPLLFDKPQLVSAVLDVNRVAQVRRNTNHVGEGELDLPVDVPRTEVFLGRSLYKECVPLHGVIGEVIVYSRAVSDQELVQIESYLQQRWGCCTE